MVRKHSKLIKEGNDEDETLDDVEMDSLFWHDIINMFFVQSREARGHEDDDLIFFVRKVSLQLQRPGDDAEGKPPYFVRRWAPKLDDLVGENAIIIDWRRSFYLNLIAHTSFSVTVAICSHQVLRHYHASQGRTLSPIYKVMARLRHGISMRASSDDTREVETTPAYPDICFAVDDFDSTFDAVVLTDTDHCYCVLLNAYDGAAFPSERKTEQPSSDIPSSENVSTAGKINNSKITLFSGFVSYQMVREAYDGGRTGFGSLLSLGHSSGRTDRIYMKGPGGRGEVEVAVSGVLDQTKMELGPNSPIHQISKRGLGIGSMVRTAASVASAAAKHAYAAAAASSNRPSEEEMLPLRCCLMSISLPWENIARDLLFKGSPPVRL
ncbi:hypothetical protein OROGR_021288 [Orobanche gracilis]